MYQDNFKFIIIEDIEPIRENKEENYLHFGKKCYVK